MTSVRPLLPVRDQLTSSSNSTTLSTLHTRSSSQFRMEDVRLGPKVVVAYQDKYGIGAGFIHSMERDPASSWKRTLSKLHLPLLSQGVALGEIINFNDASGPQVSLILLQELPKPENVYAAHAIVNFVIERAPVQASDFTLIFAATIAVPRNDTGNAVRGDEGSNQSLRIALVNLALESQKGLFEGLLRLPPSIQIGDEYMAGLLHFARVSGIPTVLLVDPVDGKEQNQENTKMQIIQLLGDCLAKNLGLILSNLKANEHTGHLSFADSVETDDWRRLYI